MRISDWSSDVCSSDLHGGADRDHAAELRITALKSNVEPPVRTLLRTGGIHVRQSLTDTGGSQLELRMTRKSRPQRFARHREMRQRAGGLRVGIARPPRQFGARLAGFGDQHPATGLAPVGKRLAAIDAL